MGYGRDVKGKMICDANHVDCNSGRARGDRGDFGDVILAIFSLWDGGLFDTDIVLYSARRTWVCF